MSQILSIVLSCLVSSAVGGVLAYLAARREKSAKRDKALGEGVRSLLRNQLIEYHEKYTERGYCPIYVKESARHSYEAYHELGGNGVITKLYEDIMALPEEEPPRGARERGMAQGAEMARKFS